jgi:pyruvate/2-oxoglutarate dehydrogenase complex dihydrolipoamide acyltransferase (E2) component
VVPIKIPDIGTAVDTVTLVRWLVEEGAEIIRGQKIAEIETDKAVIALESFAAGVLLRKRAAEGEEVSVGDVIAYIGNPTDAIPETSELEPEIQIAKAGLGTAPPREISKPRIPPMLRNFARQKGVDIDKVVGTGNDGTVTRQDIVGAAERLDADR